MKDKVLGYDSNPKTLNRYVYAQGDPVNYVDPSGHNSFAIGQGLLTIGAATSEFGIGEVLLFAGILVLGYELLTSSPDSGNSDSNVAPDSAAPTYQSGDVVSPLPNTGPPNGYLDEEHPEKGKIKGRRHYNGNGERSKDINLDHTEKPGSHVWPHVHEWIGNIRKVFENGKNFRPGTEEELNDIPKSKWPSRYRIEP